MVMDISEIKERLKELEPKIEEQEKKVNQIIDRLLKGEKLLASVEKGELVLVNGVKATAEQIASWRNNWYALLTQYEQLENTAKALRAERKVLAPQAAIKGKVIPFGEWIASS